MNAIRKKGGINVGIFIPQLRVNKGDYYFMMSDNPKDLFDDALDELKYLYNTAKELKFNIGEMIIFEHNHGNKSEAEKYIGTDLSNLQYNERKDICDKYIDTIDYFINDDFSISGTMQTLYDGRNCMRDEVDENYHCYNVGDRVITSNDGKAVVTYSPGKPYSNIHWQNEYAVLCENGETQYYYGYLLTKEET